MTTELAGSEPGLVGYWRLNEGAGSTAPTARRTGASATLFNGAAWLPGGPMGAAEPDTTPPVISSIAASNLTVDGRDDLVHDQRVDDGAGGLHDGGGLPVHRGAEPDDGHGARGHAERADCRTRSTASKCGRPTRRATRRCRRR